MTTLRLVAALVLAAAVHLPAKDYYLHSWQKIQLGNQFWSEGANVGDFNRDGKMDVVSGPYWWAGPDFKKRSEYYPATQTFKLKKSDGTEETIPGFEGALGKNNTYSENFFAFAHDLNGDRWDDILILGFPGKESFWYENPKGGSGHWRRHTAIDVTDNESPTFADLTGDGRPEIICASNGYYGYAGPDRQDPTKPWKFHRITPKGPWQRFTHGMGFGDVNGDKRNDLLEKDGWWEQPASLSGDPEWKLHKFAFSGPGGAHMYAYDVDGDGDNDVITSLQAHGYGLAWYEHVKENGEITFKPHVFMNKEPRDNDYGVVFSQPHALDLVDIDRDGLKDIVTGKRFWAHGPAGDADPNGAAVLYWFQLVRGPGHTVNYVPHLIDNDSGIGTQVIATKINGDAWPDVVIGNKKGVFVLLHQARKVSEKEWRAAQPKPQK
jgi:hypothetical protein